MKQSVTQDALELTLCICVHVIQDDANKRLPDHTRLPQYFDQEFRTSQ